MAEAPDVSELVAQVVDYAIIGLDDAGVIRTWNAGAQRLKGYTEAEAVGQHFSIFYPDQDRRDGLPQRLLERARLDGRVEHTGWRVRQDSTLFWGDVVITALHDDTGHLTGYAKVTRDLTEPHRLEQARASLFATVSHDLRSPIVSIGAGASLIANAGADERVELARHILDDAARLEELVDGLFDYVKLSNGSGTALVGPRPVVRLVRDCLAISYQRWAGRRIDIITDPTADPDGPLVLADRGAMVRVLDNVIGNAVRYSADGTPIRVQFLARGERVLVQVIDQGRGIAAEDLPTIFDEFVRGRLATDDGGTGLGLAIVRHLMTQQGGGVGIDSVLGAGTTVTLELQAVTG